MEINWKIKSKIFSLIDYFKLNFFLYLFQKYITGNSFKKSSKFNPLWEFHKKSIETHKANGSIFEFGAGKSLAQNLFLFKSVKKQILYDIQNMVDYQLVRESQKMLENKFDIIFHNNIKNKDDLIKHNIYYYAPADASKTNLKSCSIDACISTDTLEHIPLKNLEDIFKEMHRILKIDGIFSSIIDYSDHYSHTDKNLHPLNFLRYKNTEWEKKYNHSSHYQNRLRHSDYRKILSNSGFKILTDKILEKSLEIEEFTLKCTNKDDFLALRGYFLAIKV